MAITASQVKELRERTGSGMMECKKALVETDGDIEAAIETMRKSGQAKGAKKAGDYIAKQFEAAGLQPLGDKGKYFQEFPFTSGVKVEKKKNKLKVTTTEGQEVEFEMKQGDKGPQATRVVKV